MKPQRPILRQRNATPFPSSRTATPFVVSVVLRFLPTATLAQQIRTDTCEKCITVRIKNHNIFLPFLIFEFSQRLVHVNAVQTTLGSLPKMTFNEQFYSKVVDAIIALDWPLSVVESKQFWAMFEIFTDDDLTRSRKFITKVLNDKHKVLSMDYAYWIELTCLSLGNGSGQGPRA